MRPNLFNDQKPWGPASVWLCLNQTRKFYLKLIQNATKFVYRPETLESCKCQIIPNPNSKILFEANPKSDQISLSTRNPTLTWQKNFHWAKFRLKYQYYILWWKINKYVIVFIFKYTIFHMKNIRNFPLKNRVTLTWRRVKSQSDTVGSNQHETKKMAPTRSDDPVRLKLDCPIDVGP